VILVKCVIVSIPFLLTIVLTIEEHVFLVEYIFREGNRYTDIVQEQYAEKFTETSVLSERRSAESVCE
jgi:hypothetical protein